MFILTETEGGKFVGASETFESVLQLAMNTHRYEQPFIVLDTDWHIREQMIYQPKWALVLSYVDYPTPEDRVALDGVRETVQFTVTQV